ncbi:MAG: hypothetical protein IJC56_00855 [Clostridia bacterium]|nr:hypothetical protein [Clostridia bacterium]
MVDLKKLQEQVYANKVSHGFNVTSVDEEVCHIMSELAEAWEAYRKKGPEDFAEELADIAIYLLGLAEIQGIDLEREIIKKMEKNAARKYRMLENGVMVKDE